MKDIQDLIARASDSGSPLAVRHEAFAELVIGFQDMAFACAYAVLGDAYLAEDVAQDAFVVAWQKIDQLRQANAFPGWFKRIVLSQCHRLTRGKRLQIESLDTSSQYAAIAPDPHSIAEHHELLGKVLSAIKALPDNERLVTTLFYVNGYTQADIGQFLEVPVSTVNKRLYTARQRLKDSVDVFKDDLHNRRPSRDARFSERVNASLRPLESADWPPIKTMADARQQTDVPGNDLWLQHRQNFDENKYFRSQYVVEERDSRQILAFGSIEQSIYLPKYRLFIVSDPRWLTLGVCDELMHRLINDLRTAGAVTVSCREYASQVELLAFLESHSFVEVARTLDLRLDVDAADIAPLAPLMERLRASEVTIATLAEEREHDPNYLEKLYRLTCVLREDDPARSPFTAPDYYAREALMWLERWYVLPEAYFIARQKDRYIGLSSVNLFDAVPRGLNQDFTGVRREFRRQGIATALKLHAIKYARERNYKLIRSQNLPVQTAALALNKELGFQVFTTSVTLEKCLKEVIEVDAKLYDKYAGRYCDAERRSDQQMIVRNEAGRLTLEFSGQKVELFPQSTTQFFVKWFYGEVTFLPDEQGEVNELKFVIPEIKNQKRREQHARRIGPL